MLKDSAHKQLIFIFIAILGVFASVSLVKNRIDTRQRAAVSDTPTGCLPMQINQNVNYNGILSDRFTWYDSDCKMRSAALGQNNTTNAKGGVMHQYTYNADGTERIINGSGGTWQGFGYVVSHFNDTADHTSGKIGTFSTPLKGANHAIQEYRYRINIPNPVDVIISWFFATGRDNPIYSVTYDLRPSPANSNAGDSRAPYGDMQWTGSGNDPVEFVGWGDRYKFKTITTPLNFNSRWDYATPNTIPYALEWSETKNAEMGIVQTQTYSQHDGGGYWAYSFWGKNSESLGLDPGLIEPGGKMPASWNWTYQLNQYEIPFQNPVTSKRLAWGLNYGSVGQTNYNVYGDDNQASGYPFQSYSTYVILGKRSSVDKQIASVEGAQNTTLTASVGTVVTQGPGGVGRTDNVTYQPAGYNHIYGTWEVAANSQNQATFTLNTTSGTTIMSPIFVIRNYNGQIPTTIKINGVTKTKDVDFFATLDTQNHALWITILGSHFDSTQIQIDGNQTNITPTISVTPTTTPVTGKTGDLSGDNQVGILDLSILLSNWNTTNANADVNRDGQIGILDLSIMLSNWGK